MASIATAKALWLAWDGAQHAILGRSDGRVAEISPRTSDCESFTVRTFDASGGAADLLDFFWVKRNRAFIRPLVLPHAAKVIEVANLNGRRVVPIARYHLDPAQNRAGMPCDVVFAQIRRGEAENGQPPLVGNQPALFTEAETWLAPLQRNPGHSLIWAVATPFQNIDEGDVLERRVAPLSTLFPRKAELIKANPMPYRKEKEENDQARQQMDQREPAIRSVARELRQVISLEVDAPLTEVSESAVPGLVIFHYMKQRELIQLWDETTPLLRFTVKDLEELDNCKYPFARPDQVFVVRPLRAHEGLIDGLRICARDEHLTNGLVRRFTIDFAFASLGDRLVVCDMFGHRLIGQDGVPCHHLTFRVGPDELEYLDDDPKDDERMTTAALEVVESAYEAPRHPGLDDPSNALADLLNTQIGRAGLDASDLASRPLQPLFAITYMAHARQVAEGTARTDYSAFTRDPGVCSAVFLTSDMAINPAARPSGSSYGVAAGFFSLRLANELGASDFIMPPANSEADILATDLLTNTRDRSLWENAAAIGVRIDTTRADIDLFAQQLKEFRAWCENPDIVDELANTSNREVGNAFCAFLEEQQPYHRPLSAPDFDRLYALIQALARQVELSATATEGNWTSATAPARDLRTTEELKAEYTKRLNEAFEHRDPKIRAAAKRHADANYTLRKQMRDAEKELKGLIGSPEINNEILALIDKLETWAGVNSATGVRSADDRRQRIIDLARALRAHPQHSELSLTSQLGRNLGRITHLVEEECNRLRGNVTVEDGEIVTALPRYARLLGFHVAHRALSAARTSGCDIPESTTRLLSLWPERADDCWDRHQIWADTQVADVATQMAAPWSFNL